MFRSVAPHLASPPFLEHSRVFHSLTPSSGELLALYTGTFRVVNKHTGQCRSVEVTPEAATEHSTANEVSSAYVAGDGEMNIFTGMPVVGSKVIADAGVMADGDGAATMSTDIEVMIEPVVPEEYDIDSEDGGPVSEEHDGQATELRITFAKFHTKFKENGGEFDTATCTGGLHPAFGIETLFSISPAKINQSGGWF